MLKKIIFLLAILSILPCAVNAQAEINEKHLINFIEYRSDIKDVFMDYFYDDEYADDMLYYEGRLLLWIPNMINRNFISDDMITTIIDLYKETLKLKVPKMYKDEMYINAGLGKNGHEVYLKILSIMYFNMLERNMDKFTQDQQTKTECMNRLKKLFTQQDWNITVNFFNNR